MPLFPDIENYKFDYIGIYVKIALKGGEIPHKGSDVEECVTASLGVVTVLCTEDSSPLDIVAQVDHLLYQAKSSGRNRVKFGAARGNRKKRSKKKAFKRSPVLCVE